MVAGRRAFLGLLEQRNRWGFSGRGWVVIIFAIFSVSGVLGLTVYPFLAVTHRVDADVLVVEGWIHEFAIRAAADEFRSGSYERVFTTGGPVEGKGGYVNDYQTEASVGAELLKASGLPTESLEMVPSRVMNRDRTYGSAVALRNWFRGHNVPVHAINVLTEDVHARRTRLLFQEALGRGAKVGVISVSNPDYDAKHWWRYSEGVKDVLTETVGYIYAKLLFYPSESTSDEMVLSKDAAASKPSR